MEFMGLPRPISTIIVSRPRAYSKSLGLVLLLSFQMVTVGTSLGQPASTRSSDFLSILYLLLRVSAHFCCTHVDKYIKSLTHITPTTCAQMFPEDGANSEQHSLI